MAAIIGQLERALGKGKKKVFAGTVSVANGDTVDTGLSSIDFVALFPQSANRLASATVSGGTITVGLRGGTEDVVHAGCNATNAAYSSDTTLATVQSDDEITSAETVFVLAIGDPA